MQLNHLLMYCDPVGDKCFAVKKGFILTLDEGHDGRPGLKAIELVTLIKEEKEEFVVINLYHIEDAIWFPRIAFNKRITMYAQVASAK